jgi:diguanylate cyclase (GGDEF)-like protein
VIDKPGLCGGGNNIDKCIRHAAAIETLMEIARALASPSDIQEILEQIMYQVSRLLSPKAWSLLLKDEITGELEFQVVISDVAEKLKGVRLPKGRGVAGWVAENGESLIIPDVRCDTRFAAEFDRKLSFETRSIACVPVKSHDSVYGVIELINSLDDGIFDESDEQILTTIADFAGIAISNARAVEKIRELVITDDLTGLYNSRYFFEQIEYEVERSKRYQSPLSLVFFDLDRFKNVNDTHGHLTGSKLLTEVGTIVTRNIRKTDKAARYGGDEFVIILPHTEKVGAYTFASKIHKELQAHSFLSLGGALLSVTGSFGVASFPEDALCSSELISAADDAMYRVKETGRNGVQVAGCPGVSFGKQR